MGVSVSFLDNQSVTASLLNSVSANLGGSALSFANNTAYGVDDLNGITASLINRGVAKSDGNACVVTFSSGTVSIASGTLFFTSGVTAKVDNAGVTLADISGSGYVYAEYSSTDNDVKFKFSQTAPSGGDYVLLAYISAAGAVTDMRQYAYMKNASVLPNYYDIINATVYAYFSLGSTGKTYYVNTINLAAGGYKKFLIVNGDENVFLDFENDFYISRDGVKIAGLASANDVVLYFYSAKQGTCQGLCGFSLNGNNMILEALLTSSSSKVETASTNLQIYCM